MTVFDAVDLSGWETVGRLAVGLGLGAAIGAERQADGHDAGVRTHALLALGAALFGVVSVGGFSEFVAERSVSNVQVDVTRVASYVAAGVGFLAGGTIVKHPGRVKGLTTAGSLWVCAAVGLASGLGLHLAAAAATLGTLVMLLMERPVRRLARRNETVNIEAVVDSRSSLSDVLAVVEQPDAASAQISWKMADNGNVVVTIRVRGSTVAERVVSTLTADPRVVALSQSAN